MRTQKAIWLLNQLKTVKMNLLPKKKNNSFKKSDCNKPRTISIKLLIWELREGSEGRKFPTKSQEKIHVILYTPSSYPLRSNKFTPPPKKTFPQTQTELKTKTDKQHKTSLFFFNQTNLRTPKETHKIKKGKMPKPISKRTKGGTERERERDGYGYAPETMKLSQSKTSLRDLSFESDDEEGRSARSLIA
jgi:hypothetical protein